MRLPSARAHIVSSGFVLSCNCTVFIRCYYKPNFIDKPIIFTMFLNYEVVAAFGVTAVVTFFVAAVLLLMYVAKRGMLRVGARVHSPLLPQHVQPKVLTPVELMPLKVEKVATQDC